jgi:hypothetical protein
MGGAIKINPKHILCWLLLFSFYSIRISDYRGASSDTLMYVIYVIVSNFIVNRSVFLLDVSLVIIFAGIYYAYCVLKNKNLVIPLLVLMLVWAGILCFYSGLFRESLFLLSSIPFFLLTVICMLNELRLLKFKFLN